MFFLIFKIGDQKKNSARYFEIRKYAFLTLEKGISKKSVPGFSEFISILFLIFEKWIRNNFVRYFEFLKYDFSNIMPGMCQVI